MVNKAELRQFITQYFSDLELDELCFDYYPDLLNQFTSGMTKSQKVIALIGYCDRRGLTNHLLTTLAKLRATAYQSQFGLVPKPQASTHAAGRNPNQIFLSHANQDAAFTRELAGDLRQNGFEIWMAPESIEPGEKWVDAIERGLETSGIFVLVITPHAADSKWVRDESNYAIALQNKDEMRLFTLLVGEGRIPPMWSVRQHISFRDDYDDGLRQLLAALRPDRFAAPPKPVPTPAPARPAPPQLTPEKKPDATPKTAPPFETAPSSKPETERAAAVSKAAEPPPVTRAPSPTASTAEETATRAASTPIVAPDPVPDVPATKAAPRKQLYAALGVVALLAVIFIGWRLTTAGGGNGGTGDPPVTEPGDDNEVVESSSNSTNQDGEIRTVSRGGVEVEQVFVPAGSFMMGSEDGDSDEQPVHEVALDAFWIDRTEVTNAQYAACVVDGACQPPSDTSSYTRDSYYGNEAFANFPVLYVSWGDATDFCEWTGGRLPTEAEWEYAARGPESLVYPWSDEFDGEQLNYCDVNCSFDHADKNVDDGYADTAPAGSYPDGASWVGALDLAGNVWEWVNDWYDSGYYGNSPGENPPGPASGEYRVLRGGAWYDLDNFALSSYRYYGPSGQPLQLHRVPVCPGVTLPIF